MEIMPDSTYPQCSTSDFKSSQFRPHGVVNIWMDGPLLHYEARGPYNTELFDLLAIAQRDFLTTTQPQSPWVSICTIKESAMTSPEGAIRYKALLESAKSANLEPLATAFVVGPEVEGGGIMEPIFTKIFADIGRTFAAFKTMAEAQAWAMALIEEARAAQPRP